MTWWTALSFALMTSAVAPPDGGNVPAPPPSTPADDSAAPPVSPDDPVAPAPPSGTPPALPTLPAPPPAAPTLTPAPDQPSGTRWGQLAAGCGACAGGGLVASLATLALPPTVLSPAVDTLTRDALQIGSPCNTVTVGFCTGAVLFTGAAAGTGAVMAAVEHEAHPEVDATTTVLAPTGVAVVGVVAVAGATYALTNTGEPPSDAGYGSYDLFVLVPVATLGAIVFSPLVVGSAWAAWDASFADAAAPPPASATPAAGAPAPESGGHE